jgi:hypothetical protein
MWTFYRENWTYSGGPVLNKLFLSSTNYKKGTKCGPFIEKIGPTQEIQCLISSFWAGPRHKWDQEGME